jgi:hypothetical protein
VGHSLKRHPLHFAQFRIEFTVVNCRVHSFQRAIHVQRILPWKGTAHFYQNVTHNQHVTTSQHSNPSRPKAILLGSKHMVLRLIAALRTHLWRWRRTFCPKDPPGGYCGRRHYAFDVNHRYHAEMREKATSTEDIQQVS